MLVVLARRYLEAGAIRICGFTSNVMLLIQMHHGLVGIHGISFAHFVVITPWSESVSSVVQARCVGVVSVV
jgi:hypothetical protein